jgi:hypothetical protein
MYVAKRRKAKQLILLAAMAGLGSWNTDFFDYAN